MKKTKPTVEEIMIEISDHPKLQKVAFDSVSHYLLRKDGMYHCGNCHAVFGKAANSINPFVCPKCGLELQKKSITSRTKWQNLETEVWVNVLQKQDGRIAFRGYIVDHYVGYDLKEVMEIREVERRTIYNNDYHIYARYSENHGWYNYYYNDTIYGKKHRKIVDIYPESIEEFLKDTELKYTGVGEYIDQEKKKYEFYLRNNAYLLMIRASHYPWIEYLKKSGMTKLYMDVLWGYADMRVVRPSLIRKERVFIQQHNANATMIIAKQMFDKAGFRLDLSKLKGTTPWDLGRVRNLIKYATITEIHPERIANYLDSIEIQKEVHGCGMNYAAHDHWKDYEDYLEMNLKIGIKPNTEQMALPKDLKKAHDDVIGKFNALKSELETQAYKDIYSKIRKLEYAGDHYCVVAPKSVSEIFEEGKALDHCVGSYSKKVLDGETIILFIRNIETPNTPFYTMEYKSKSIIQIRGDKNKVASIEVKAFTEEWLKWVKKPKRKPKETESRLNA